MSERAWTAAKVVLPCEIQGFFLAPAVLCDDADAGRPASGEDGGA